MNIERLFNILVVTGASSTVGLFGCSSDKGTSGGNDAGTGTGGSTSTGGKSSGDGGGAATGGGTSSGGSATDAGMCSCGPSKTVASWIDCNGCCCWLAVGQTTMIGSQICGDTPCCKGKGPGR